MEELTDFEELINKISQLATLVRAYYDALVESGFSNKDALALTVQYQRDILNMAKSSGNKTE